MTEQPETPEPTPDQRFAAAHRRLEEALEEFYREASAAGGAPALLIDWTLVTAGHIDLGDGTTMTTHHIFAPSDAAAYRSLGLLEYGTNYVKNALNAGGVDL